MSRWYRQVTADMSNIVLNILISQTEIEQARLECGMKGVLEKQAPDMLPTRTTFSPTQKEVEAHSTFNTKKCEKILCKISQEAFLKVIIEHPVETLTDL